MSTISHNNFFSVCGVSLIIKQLLPLALMFILGIDRYKKGVIVNPAIFMGVVEIFSMKSSLLKILCPTPVL